jgi:hypothetical protein
MVDLRGDVGPFDVARDAVPPEPGLYAWWSRPGALPGITGPRPPDGEHELVYVGLARSGPSSRVTLRSRVVGNHEARHLGYRVAISGPPGYSRAAAGSPHDER